MSGFAVINEKSFSEAYVRLLQLLMNEGKEKAPRGQRVKFFQNCLFHVDNPGDMFTCPSREFPIDYLNHELKLYYEGDCSAEKFGQASKFWLKLQNPDGTINSNYGYLTFYKEIDTKFGKIENQWTYAKSQLMHDKDTRQALMFISSPHVQFMDNKDFICTLNYVFNIEDDVLNLTVNRRSQDVILGITYDYAWEYTLLLKMHNELLDIYPNLKLGSYTMFCNNIHVYERNWDMVRRMLNDVNNPIGSNMERYDLKKIIDPEIMQKYVYNKGF